jgi:uncharacterized protein
MPAGRALAVMLTCLVLWAFLSSPALKRSAETSPDGARRTVSLAILSPLAAISDTLQLTRATDALERVMGRDPDEAPGGEIVIPPEPLPSAIDGVGPATQEPHVTGPIRTPTTSNELRVVVIGDSLAAGLGTYMERVLRPSLVRVSRQGRISTGLARPDYFDWWAAMRQIADNYRPDLVIVMLGENDNQPLRKRGGAIETDIGNVAWPKAYRERVEGFLRVATSRGARVVWLGLPVVRNQERWPTLERQNGVYARAARSVPNVSFLDTWDMFDAPDGRYTTYYRQEGTVLEVREADGVHFNATGYELLARAVTDLATDEFGLDPRVVEE